MRRRLTAVLACLTLASTIAATIAVPVAAAKSTPRPVPGYRPDFVTETDVPPPYKDCLWSAGAMLLDKWTSGRRTIGHAKLRRLSGDPPDTGSSLLDLQASFAKLGLRLPTSPDGGAQYTWSTVIKRLKTGGGAVVAGDYGRLPARYTRWDPAFARTSPAGHALYLDRYDARRDRIWVMDPLAPAGWPGEWIPARLVFDFTWKTGRGYVYAALTSAGKKRPFDGVALGEARVTIEDGVAIATWPIEKTPRGWRPTDASLEAVVTRLTGDAATVPDAIVHVATPELEPTAPDPVVDAPLALAAEAAEAADGDAGEPTVGAVPADAAIPADVAAPAPTSAPPPDGHLWRHDGLLRGAMALPTEPGTYLVVGRIVDHRFGVTARGTPPTPALVVYVPGPTRSSFEMPPAGGTAGEPLTVRATIQNTGLNRWFQRAAPAVPGTVAGRPDRTTSLLVSWEPADPSVELMPPPVDLGVIDLAPGERLELETTLPTPSTPGAWSLRFELVDSEAGPFSALGSPAGFGSVYLLPPADPGR